MLSRKSYQTKRNVIKEIKPNDAQYYQENYTKRYIMLSGKSNETMHNVIREIQPDNA